MEFHATGSKTSHTPIKTKMHVLIITNCYPTKKCCNVGIKGRHIIRPKCDHTVDNGQKNYQKRNAYSKIFHHVKLLENKKFWLRWRESNSHHGFWRPLYCHCTTPERISLVYRLCYSTGFLYALASRESFLRF